MRLEKIEPPREFDVGLGKIIRMKECARIELAPDEQVTFVTEQGGEYDLARKNWGFYATPSLNDRLQRFGLRGVLVKNRLNRFFVLLVEQGKEAQFDDYLKVEGLELVSWMDTNAALERLERGIKSADAASRKERGADD